MQSVEALLQSTHRKPEETLGVSIALGTLIQAMEMADELQAQNKLPCPRKAFIDQKHDELMKQLLESTYKMGKSLTEASSLLSEHLPLLPEEEKNKYYTEWQKATKLLQALQNDPSSISLYPQILSANNLQQLLSISYEHLSWIYKVAHTYFDEQANEKAYTLFSFLVFLNGMVFDFWLRLGILQLRLQNPQEALSSFFVASKLDPTSICAQYDLVKLLLHLEKFAEAPSEIEKLRQLAVSQNNTDMLALIDPFLSFAEQKTPLSIEDLL